MACHLASLKTLLFFFYSKQDDYLNECLKFLATVIETGNFLDLIQDKEAHDYKLFNKKMTTILNQVSAEAIYKNANTIFVEQDRSQYVNVRNE